MADLRKLGLTPEQLLGQEIEPDPGEEVKDETLYLLRLIDTNHKEYLQVFAHGAVERDEKFNSFIDLDGTMAIIVQKIQKE